jgi:hypothetical protein
MLEILPACIYGLAFLATKIDKIRNKLEKLIKKKPNKIKKTIKNKEVPLKESITSVDEKQKTKLKLSEKKSPINSQQDNFLPRRTTHSGDYRSDYTPTTIHPETEQKCRRILETIYGVPFPSNETFVRNPRTGKWLTLDGYNPHLKIAFEYQGEQHYQYPNFFSKQNKMTKEQFRQGVWRDWVKKRACEKAGITLLIIPYNQRAPGKLERYIRSIAP